MSNSDIHWKNSSEVFHQRAKEYDNWFENSLLFDIEAAAVRALSVQKHSPSLEIGVGSGRFAKILHTEIGNDPAFAALKIAGTRNILPCQAVGESLPYRSNSFARISIFFTLCFVQNPAKVLREAHRVLQNTGSLILGFIPSTSKWGADLQQKKESAHPFYEYANFFTVTDIETLLAEQGFSIRDSVSSLYQAPGEIQQMESPRSGIDKDAGFIVLRACPK